MVAVPAALSILPLLSPAAAAPARQPSLHATIAAIHGAATAATARMASMASTAPPSYTLFGWDHRAESAPVVLSGTFSNAPAGARARIFSKPFPFTGKAEVGETRSLTVASDGSAPFSFAVQPETATQYFVELLNPGGSVNNTFELRTVYVASTRALVPGRVNCSTGTCEISFSLWRFLPAAVARFELAKPYYDYLGLSFAKSAAPSAPDVMRLQSGWRVSRTAAVPRVSSEYETTFTFSFRLRGPHYSYVSDACTIDSEPRDGFGLPGRHGCGSSSLPVGAPYLG